MHSLFELAGVACAFGVTWFVRRNLHPPKTSFRTTPLWTSATVAGSILGGFLFGSLNAHLSSHPGAIARSILGALVGAIVVVETVKHRNGVKESTGAVLVPGLTIAIIVGRLGCFVDGLRDFTYGTATTLPWAVDFGDGILRHPVQLYEASCMAAFLAVTALGLWIRPQQWLRNGFYLFTLAYGTQRFLWEFLKPYERIAGPLNLFHLLCLALIAYAIHMLIRQRHQGTHP